MEVQRIDLFPLFHKPRQTLHRHLNVTSGKGSGTKGCNVAPTRATLHSTCKTLTVGLAVSMLAASVLNQVTRKLKQLYC